ncbi:hypothetical protein EV715DRAFT_286733 [Schizophyllum commune]
MSDVDMPHPSLPQSSHKRKPSRSPPRERSQRRRPIKKPKTQSAAAAAIVAKMRKKFQERRAAKTKEGRAPRKELHITKAERHEDAASTMLAFQTHLRMIGELYDQDDLPPAVSEEMRNSYKDQYDSAAKARRTVKSLAAGRAPQADSALERVQAIRETLEAKRIKPDTLKDAKIVSRILDIDIFGMQVAFGRLASFGLLKWLPDIGPGCDPNSQYNAYYEAIAIESFQQAARVGAYVAFGINEEYINKTSFLRGEYRSYVFSYLKQKAASERRKPGSTKQKTEKNKMYVRRQRLAQARTALLKAQGFPDRTLALSKETAAHSDDEMEFEDIIVDGVAQKNPVYRIREKVGRSGKVTHLFRMVDRMRIAQAAAHRPGKVERTRKPQEQSATTSKSRTSQLTRIPTRVPIDYFSPEYWNESMTLRQRVEFLGQRGGRARVALPKAEFCKTWADCEKWTNLKEDAFMREYGDAVLKDYSIPTDEQIARIDELEDAAEDSDSEEEYEEWQGFGSGGGGRDSDNQEEEEVEEEAMDSGSD